jgi:hypothetical protein
MQKPKLPDDVAFRISKVATLSAIGAMFVTMFAGEHIWTSWVLGAVAAIAAYFVTLISLGGAGILIWKAGELRKTAAYERARRILGQKKVIDGHNGAPYQDNAEAVFGPEDAMTYLEARELSRGDQIRVVRIRATDIWNEMEARLSQEQFSVLHGLGDDTEEEPGDDGAVPIPRAEAIQMYETLVAFYQEQADEMRGSGFIEGQTYDRGDYWATRGSLTLMEVRLTKVKRSRARITLVPRDEYDTYETLR